MLLGGLVIWVCRVRQHLSKPALISGETRAGRGSSKRVDDGQAGVDQLPVLHVLAEQFVASRFQCGSDDQAVVNRKPVWRTQPALALRVCNRHLTVPPLVPFAAGLSIAHKSRCWCQ
jgi:hypothetical protein